LTWVAAALLAWPTVAAAGPIDRWSGPVAEASRRFGIPADWIVRVMRIESGGRTDLGGRPVVSRAGAMGLMQLMPATWRDLRAQLGIGSDPFDPRDNILAGAAYLRAMYDRFGYPGLFAAYNAGPGRYAAVLSGARVLPAETRLYLAALAPAPRHPPPRHPRSGAAPFAFRTGLQRAGLPPLRDPAATGLFVALGEAPQ